MAAQRRMVLRAGQRLAGGHAQLPGHQVLTGHRLGHRVLHLQAGVHLHEEEVGRLQPLGGVDDEFDGAGTHIVDGLGRLDRRRAHGFAQGRRHVRGGRLLDHLLVAALDRTVALEQMDDGAVGVAEHLHLDVARLGDELFDQHPVVAERALRLALGGGQGGLELVGVVDPAHALAAAAGHRLDQHGKADVAGRGLERVRGLVLAVIAGYDGHPGVLHQLLGRVLQPHGPDRVGRRADEGEAGRSTRLGESRVFGQEAVAGVDGLRAGAPGRVDDGVGLQVAVGGRGRADVHRLVGHAHVQRLGVGVGIDRDGRDAHLPRRADHAAGDLPAVGDQDLGEHAAGPSR